jgi:hypothetical protein
MYYDKKVLTIYPHIDLFLSSHQRDRQYPRKVRGADSGVVGLRKEGGKKKANNLVTSSASTSERGETRTATQKYSIYYIYATMRNHNN